MGAASFYYLGNGNFSEGRDHIFVTPHPSESHPISLSPCVDRDIIGYIDTHTPTPTHTEEIFLRQRVRLDVRMV